MTTLRLAILLTIATLGYLGCGGESANNTEGMKPPNSATPNNVGPNNVTPNDVTPTNNAAPQTWCREPFALELPPRPVHTEPISITQGPEFIWGIVAIDNRRRVVRSTDGFQWQVVEVPTGSTLKRVLANESVVVVTRTRDTYDVSTDGGESWSTTTVQGDMSTAQYASLPDGTLIRWRLGDGAIESSTDAQSWTPVPTNRDEPMLALSIGGDGTLAVTRSDVAELTTDLGQTWATATPPGPFESFYVFTSDGERRMIARSVIDRRLTWESLDGETWDETRVLGGDPVPVQFVQVGDALFADGGWSGEPVLKRSSPDNWFELPSTVESIAGHFQTGEEHRLITGGGALTTTDINGRTLFWFQFDEPVVADLDAAGGAFGQTVASWSWLDHELQPATMLAVIGDDCMIKRTLREGEFRTSFNRIWHVPGLVAVTQAEFADPEASPLIIATDDSFEFFEPELPFHEISFVDRVDDTFIVLGSFQQGRALVRSLDGVEWTAPEPVLKTPETIALEDADSPIILANNIVDFGDGWLATANTGFFGEDGLYVSENLTDWSRAVIDLPIDEAGTISVRDVATTADLVVADVTYGPSDARSHGVFVSTNLSEWRQLQPDDLGDFTELHEAGPQVVLEVTRSPAFGSPDAENRLYVLRDGAWNLVTDDPDISWRGWAPGRFLLADQASLVSRAIQTSP